MPQLTHQMKSQMRIPFTGMWSLNHYEAGQMQDLFVLQVLDGRWGGSYLEIGANDPVNVNNTHVLETNFGWHGRSFEIDPHLVGKFNSHRRNRCIQGDAMIHDYCPDMTIRGVDNAIDYLSVDIEPPRNTLKALQEVIRAAYQSGGVRFKVITFEHDRYTGTEGDIVRTMSRQFLTSIGYSLAVPDVCFDPEAKMPAEDWWIHSDPNLINTLNFTRMHSQGSSPIYYKNVIFTGDVTLL